MTNVDIVKDFAAAFGAGDVNRMRDLLADDFLFDHANHEGTNDRAQFLGIVTSLKTAFPDLKMDLRNFEGDGSVRAEARLVGTHTGVLDLQPMGLQKFQPTGKALDMTWEPASWRIQGGRIVEHRVQATERGGVPGVLMSLGLEAPRKV